MKLWYDPGLTRLARELRKRSTLVEVLLWRQLRNGQRQGYDFHRQKPIDRYIVDFFCSELMLAVEIDGDSHKLKGKEDERRQRSLEIIGVRFLHFKEEDVRRDLDAVVRQIDNWIENDRSNPRSTHPGASRHPS